MPGSYSGASINTNPNDADIVWNGLYNRWELSFNSIGAGGYFIKTQTESIVPKTLDKVGLTSATPAAVAYSLRLLSSAYAGAAITVRRSSDNATQNIGFTPDGHLDTASLKAFVGSGNGYVARWYDQSGNNFPAEQGNNALQPVIVNSGVVERINRLPAVYFNATHLLTRKEYMFTQGASLVGVAKGNNNTPSAFVTKTGTAAGSNPAHPGPFDYTNAGAEFTVGDANTATYNSIHAGNSTPRSTVNDQAGESVYSFVIPSMGTYYNYVNGVQAGNQPVPAFADGGNSLMLGNRNDGSSAANFHTPEIILFNLALTTADRQQVESAQSLFTFLLPYPYGGYR
ncbi:arabinofuranosidase catalytic domain-containing protein [Paraflavitalea speifideaquila]|uniref:arabinofuranosidase catalytic domain-containing protein n=1 Tax=Paraflavitalea speifideaquila TaxID=3076558 RepID=UPI0028EB8CA8|nr:arabinofuranosidase catalytic domain-containing protein [Paraflavitalea speifideiaquila]